ncbi:MAG: ABC transporter permease [Thermoprotei archaeon]|nr:MAG: ABC transporter permease [Thermoprotei archaeon]
MRGYLVYLGKRIVVLTLTLIIATYLTVIIANLGGALDELIKEEIRSQVIENLMRGPQSSWFRQLPPEEQERIIEERTQERIRALGLDAPFWQRSLIYLRDALTLSLGRARWIKSWSASSDVKIIIFERLPWSVLLFTTGTTISAAVGLTLGLYMGRKALSKFDRGMSMLAIVLSSLPAWFLGVLLILVFSFQLGWFPSGGRFSPRIHENVWDRTLDFLWHLSLPLASWVLTGFGSWAYVTRNLVIHILHEDYVMAARARGLPESLVMRRYVLRPAAPPIITMIALSIIGSWTGAIVTETVFQWDSMGVLYYEAITCAPGGDPPVIIGVTVMYAYLLVLTIFILDIIYALLDPRVRAGGGK